MSEEEMSPGRQVSDQFADNGFLHLRIEIDQAVTAEDGVELLVDIPVGLFEVQATEFGALPQLGLDAHLAFHLSDTAEEVSPLQVAGDGSDGVALVNSLLRPLQYICIDVCG